VLKFLLLCLQIANAWGGTATSGGGGAFVKRQPMGDGPVQAAMLVDIWEARNIPFDWPAGVGTIVIADESGAASPEESIASALSRLANVDAALARQVESDYHYIREHVNILPKGILIQLPDDLRVDYFPKGFPPEGMMRFNGLTGLLDVNDEIFAHLISPQHVAGAWLHEALYKTLRESAYMHRDSIAVRHLNACLLSTEESCLPRKPAMLPKDRWVYECRGEVADYWVYPLSKQPPYDTSGYRLVYSRFNEILHGEVMQEAQQVLFNPDGTMQTATTGNLRGPLAKYGYGPGTAVVELKLNGRGEFLGAVTRSAHSSLQGGRDLLPNGAETPNCRPYKEEQ
jgi:hypothetical protein